MPFLSGLCKIRKQILHLMDEYSFSKCFFFGRGLDSVSATKRTEGSAVFSTGFTLLQLHCPAWKMRIWGQAAGQCCCMVPWTSERPSQESFVSVCQHYCSCLPIASLTIYSYRDETWMILLSIHWTASRNTDFPLQKTTIYGIWELDGPMITSVTKIQEINDD